MLNSILLIVTSIFIPVIIFYSLYLYKYKNNHKVSRILIISSLSIELFRFFYNASFYDKAKTPSGYLTFSFITFLIIFGLFAVFNTAKLGTFFKRVFSYSFAIPTLFAIFAPRVYLSQQVEVEGTLKYLDTYSVLPCLYFIECGLLITLGIIFLTEFSSYDIKKHSISLVFALAIYVVYTGISIGTKFTWEIEYNFDLNFYLSVFIPVLSMFIIYIISILLSKKKASKETKTETI
ncbi:MAG: hypothetical protein ACI311_07395 [Bacilli bacterium]